jgi:hypothetical protein
MYQKHALADERIIKDNQDTVNAPYLIQSMAQYMMLLHHKGKLKTNTFTGSLVKTFLMFLEPK